MPAELASSSFRVCLTGYSCSSCFNSTSRILIVNLSYLINISSHRHGYKHEIFDKYQDSNSTAGAWLSSRHRRSIIVKSRLTNILLHYFVKHLLNCQTIHMKLNNSCPRTRINYTWVAVIIEAVKIKIFVMSYFWSIPPPLNFPPSAGVEYLSLSTLVYRRS